MEQTMITNIYKHYMKLNLQRQWPNTEGFETGVDVFDKEEQEKLQVRAERFGINSDESQALNNVQLQDLHNSLGITTENEKNVRFEAIHVNGTDEMSTQDVFVYFEAFAPNSIEWIDDTSCNVVWNDKVSAARALLRLSDPIGGMPVEGPCDPFADKEDEDEGTSKGRSILLLGKDREVQMKDEENDKENGNAATIHVSDITAPVPPGYWRLGKSMERSRFILLRFALRTDKKPFRAERFSQFYKKYGNPNFGGLKGIISESKKKKMKGIFDRHDSVNAELEEQTPEAPVSGNPWGSLAKNWNRDHRLEKTAEFPADPLVSSPVLKSSGILKRLGHKRAAASSGSESESTKVEAKKSKVPRMRMYADEEEEKIRRKKALKLLGKIHEQTSAKEPEKPDLRRKLNQAEPRIMRAGVVNKMPEIKQEPERDLRDMRSRIPRREMVDFRVRKPVRPEYSEPDEEPEEEPEEEDDEEEDSDESPRRVQQKSKVMVIIKKQRKPTVASTVWSRMNDARAKKTRHVSDEEDDDEEEEEDDDGSSSEIDEDLAANREKLRAAVNRPGFSSGSLKSRLGVKPTDHKSPLRIEINNDLFKSKAAK